MVDLPKYPSILFDDRRRKKFMDPEAILANLDIEPGMTIADFGCGAGFFSIPAAEIAKEGKVYCIDIQEPMLEVTKNKAEDNDVSNIELIKGNIEEINSLSIKNESVDLILISNILFQSENKLNVLKEARRLIKPIGRILVIEWAKNSPFGPEANQRLSEKDVIDLAEKTNLKLEKGIKAGSYHFGLIFKPTL